MNRDCKTTFPACLKQISFTIWWEKNYFRVSREREFSEVNLIENKLRSVLWNRSLNDLLMMKLHGPPL
jgi:hypothetical protein